MIEVPPRACRPIHEATPSLAVPRSSGGIMSITRIPTVALITLTTALLGCGADQDPAAPGLAAASASSASISASSWGPETPPFNDEVILRDATGNGGFGHVKFRQPNDVDRIVNLDAWVRDLEPNATYRLQRATDTSRWAPDLEPMHQDSRFCRRRWVGGT